MELFPLEPFHFGNGRHRLFAVHQPVTERRGAVLMCAPFLHEHFLSYRLLSLVARRLASQGIASLRFDYFGTGDSYGDGEEFSLAGATRDAEAAFEELARRYTDTPLGLMGARSGAWPAAMLAERHGLPLWLWQPLADGAAWMDWVEQLDAKEHASRLRYPMIGSGQKAEEPGRRVGYACAAPVREEIRAVRLDRIVGTRVAGIAEAIDDAADEFAPADRHLRLPPAVSAWHSCADMQATFFTPALSRVVDELASVGLADRAA